MGTFGGRLRTLRSRKKMTQKELGERFQLSESAIGMYERDQREPSLLLVRELADFFAVSIDYLMGRDNSIRENGVSYGSDSGQSNWTEEERTLADAFIRTLRAEREASGKRTDKP